MQKRYPMILLSSVITLVSALILCNTGANSQGQTGNEQQANGQTTSAGDNQPLRRKAHKGAPKKPKKQDPLHIYKLAGIDNEQEEAIKKLVTAFESKAHQDAIELLKLIDEMREFSTIPDPKPKDVMAKQAQINKLHASMSNNRIKLMLDIRKVMRKEQKEELVKILKQHKMQPMDTAKNAPASTQK